MALRIQHGCILFVSFAIVCLFVFCLYLLSLVSLPGDDFFASYFSHPLIISVCFLFFFSYDRVPDLDWFGSVYLVTKAGFVADQSMRDKTSTATSFFLVFVRCLFRVPS